MSFASPNFKLALPPASFFHLPPSSDPQPLAPATDEPTFKAPFSVDPSTYRTSLSPPVPITFAVLYITFVLLANRYNRRNGNKPFAFSQTKGFHAFEIVHNIVLTIYSGVTCVAMIRALHASVVSPFAPTGIPGTLDSLCKMNGPRGLGAAATYTSATSSWGSRNSLIQMAADTATPDPSDVGRIWNEGLAFWGWIFYLSKMYEVVDTILILAKGKRSATLQTYHHAGALLCMWAGIRYMSAPIWMFVLVNSGIHTLMYTYYTVTRFRKNVPQGVKRTLTTMQISQFVVGATYATLHLFVYYTIPVTLSYTLGQSASAATSAIPSSVSSVASLASGNWPHLGKQAMALLAGSPGIAKRMQDSNSYDYAGSGSNSARDTIRYRTGYEMVHCLNTEGQAFAIWLNVLYFIPLTVLFVRFFVKSYVFGQSAQAGKEDAGRPRHARRISESVHVAARKTSDTFETLGQRVEEGFDTVAGEVQKGGEHLHAQEDLKRTMKDLKDKAKGTMGRDSGEVIEEEDEDVGSGEDMGSGELVEREPEDKSDDAAETLHEIAEKVKQGEDAKPQDKADENGKPQDKSDENAKPQDKSEENAKPQDKSEGNAKPQDKSDENAKPQDKSEDNAKSQDNRPRREPSPSKIPKPQPDFKADEGQWMGKSPKKDKKKKQASSAPQADEQNKSSDSNAEGAHDIEPVKHEQNNDEEAPSEMLHRPNK